MVVYGRLLVVRAVQCLLLPCCCSRSETRDLPVGRTIDSPRYNWPVNTLVAFALVCVAVFYIASCIAANTNVHFKSLRAVQTFNGFGRLSKFILVLMFFSGWILFAFSWFTDLGVDVRIDSWDIKRPTWLQPYNQKWMSDHAYAPNILAGLTGFLIGAPVAAVILASFTTEREEKAALDRVNRLSEVAWNSFRDLVCAYTSKERYELIVDQARDIKKYYDEASTAVDVYIEYTADLLNSPEYPENPDTSNLTDQIEVLKTIEGNFRLAINAVRQNINFFETEDEWAQIVGSWRVLDQYVRLQRLEQGLEWFDKAPDAGLRKWTSRRNNPFQELLDAIEIRTYTPNMSSNVDTMANALDTLWGYANTDNPINLGEWLMYEGNIFKADRSREYHMKCDAAQLFILDLQRYISLVHAMYWPVHRRYKTPHHEGDKPIPLPHEALAYFTTPEGSQKLIKGLKRIVRWRMRLHRILWGFSPDKRLPGFTLEDLDKL